MMDAQGDSTIVKPTADIAEVYGVNAAYVRALVIKLLLACLVIAAGIAVVTILMGSFTDTVWRSIGTVIVAVIHLLLIFGVLSMMTPTANDAGRRSMNIFTNVMFTIVILSFLTAIFSIWGLLEASIAWKLYVTYGVAFAAMIHGKVLADVVSMTSGLRWYAYANYFFIALIALLILVLVYFDTQAQQLLSGFYGRVLAAVAVIDITLSMVVAVMQRLHEQKHPELYVNTPGARTSIGRVVVMIIILLLFSWTFLPYLFYSSLLGS